MKPDRVSRTSVAGLGVAIAAVVGASVARLSRYGFAGIAPDDAQYIGVGRAIWSLHKPAVANGSLYTIRSWVYPVMVGAASRLTGDPFLGPRVLLWVLGTGALVLAVTIAYKLARAPGAIGTALALLMTPLLWTLVPSTLVDVCLMAFMLLSLLAIAKPTPGRMLLAGVLVGLTLLVKETSAPLVVLPLAFLGTMPVRAWSRLAIRFLIAFGITVSWWFVIVLVERGQLFPLQGVEQIERRTASRSWVLTSSSWWLIAAWLMAWIVIAVGRRHEPYGRVLMLAGLAFVPASVIAWTHGLAQRQLGPLVILSCIALGVAAADALRLARSHARSHTERVAVAALALVLVAVAVVPSVLTQDRVTQPEASDVIDARVARAIMGVGGGARVMSTFRYKQQLWARIAERATVRRVPFEQSTRPPKGTSAVWADYSRDTYFSIPRTRFAKDMGDADYLVLSGPHRIGPIGLATWLVQHGASVGLVPVAQIHDGAGAKWAYVFRVAEPTVNAIPTVLSTTAAERISARGLLHLRPSTVLAGSPDALARLGAALPPGSFEPLPAPVR